MKLDFLKKLNFLSKLNKEQRIKLFNKIMLIFVYVSAVIAVACMIYLKTSKIRIKDNTVELGNKYYLDQLLSYDNVKVSDGYRYNVKENNIDINVVGEYEITFEIAGYGEELEETKKIKVVDTTPADVEMKNKVFYIGDTVDLSKELVITDISNKGEIPYAEANVKVNKDINTSKAGEVTIKVTTTDKNGVEGTTEFTIEIKDPMVSLQTYIESKIAEYNKTSYNDYEIVTTDGDFILKTGSGSYYTTINFTDGVYYNQSGTSYSDTINFNSSFKATKYVYKGYYSTSTYTSGSALTSAQKTLDGALKIINDLLNDSNGKIGIYGKTAEEIKTVVLDLRTLR